MPNTIFRLIYRSHSLIPEDQRKAVLGEIFSVARSNNKRQDITGALVLHDDVFVQALEGDEQPVQRLYDQIAGDARHQDVEIVDERRLDERTFGKWSMARVGNDGEADIPLLMNRDKGGISPKQPDPVTPDQEVVLDYMRTIARQER